MGWYLGVLLLDKTEKQLEPLIWPLLPGATVARCTSGGSYPEGNETTRQLCAPTSDTPCGWSRATSRASGRSGVEPADVGTKEPRRLRTRRLKEYSLVEAGTHTEIGGRANRVKGERL